MVSLLVIQSSASQFEMTQKSMPKELNDVQIRHWIDEPLDPTEPFRLRVITITDMLLSSSRVSAILESLL